LPGYEPKIVQCRDYAVLARDPVIDQRKLNFTLWLQVVEGEKKIAITFISNPSTTADVMFLKNHSVGKTKCLWGENT